MTVSEPRLTDDVPAPHELVLTRPRHRLDPLARDIPGEGRALQRIGPLVPVELPDQVMAWAVTRRELADTLLTHPDLRKNPRHWTAYQDGLVPETWPLLQIITTPTMLIMDGADHTRLRRPIQQAFTPRRVEALRPRIEQIVRDLLDELATTAPDTVVDLRTAFAFRVPATVICELYGVDDPAMRRELAADTAALLSSTTPPDDRMAAQGSIFGIMVRLVSAKRARPGDDLTTALIAEFDEERLAEDELIGTLFLMLIAGHETTQNLLSNAIKDLAENPDALAEVLDGGPDLWRGVVEEALRLDAPAATTMFLYAVRDVTVAGVTIREGEPVLIYTAALGRDDQVFDDPDAFRPGRPDAHQHRAFGHGPHHCLGAPLARLEAQIALPALHERFVITPAEPLAEVERLESLSSNAPARLPVRLAPRQAERP